MQKIIFSDDDLNICKEFSEAVDTKFYAGRNQWDANKRKIDAKIGKLGELAVYYSLKDKYPDISYPDFKIYTTRQKSWDYDLKSTTFNLHCKTQENLQSIKFSKSWIFQAEDKHIFRDNKDNDYVAFVCVNMLEKSAVIQKILSVNSLHTNKLFKKPVLAKLVSKLAVYFEDIKDFNCELI